VKSVTNGTMSELMDFEDDPAASSSNGAGDEQQTILDPGQLGSTTCKMTENQIQVGNMSERYKAREDDFEKLKLLGRGGYGKVFLVRKKFKPNAGTLYAMKVLKKAKIISSDKDTAHIKSERNILGLIRHPFIVNLHYAFQTRGNLFLVLEYVQGGELFMMLEREGILPEDKSSMYLAQIVLALGHLHDLGIIFRDLKPENILLDAEGFIKLIDFGLCKEYVDRTPTGRTFTYCGTIEYMAPEVITKQGHDHSADWWSLGTLMFDMLTGSPPFSADSKRETQHRVLHDQIRLPTYLSAEAKDLLKKLLKRTPTSRLGAGEGDAEEIKEHAWFNAIDWHLLINRQLKPLYVPQLQGPEDVSLFDRRFTTASITENSPCSTPLNGQDVFKGFTFTEDCISDQSIQDREFRSERQRRQAMRNRAEHNVNM